MIILIINYNRIFFHGKRDSHDDRYGRFKEVPIKTRVLEERSLCLINILDVNFFSARGKIARYEQVSSK